MGFTEANQSLASGKAQNLGILLGRAPLEIGRPGFGGDAGGIEEVFPRDRHAVQGRKAVARLGAGARGAGGINVIARSASAVMVSDGFTPGFAEIAEPSITSKPG